MQPRELSFTHQLNSLDDYAEVEQNIGGEGAAQDSEGEKGDFHLRQAAAILSSLFSDADFEQASEDSRRIFTHLVSRLLVTLPLIRVMDCSSTPAFETFDMGGREGEKRTVWLPPLKRRSASASTR